MSYIQQFVIFQIFIQPFFSIIGVVHHQVVWAINTGLSFNFWFLSTCKGNYSIGSLEIVLYAVMTHPLRFLYQYGYPKEEAKKADVQISNLKFHLCKQYCYFLYLEKKIEYSEFQSLILSPKLTYKINCMWTCRRSQVIIIS